MTDDLVERLREQLASLQASSGYEASIAQVEIERLTGVLKDRLVLLKDAYANVERLTEEVDALRLVATAHDTEMLRLEAALRWGIGAALNELTARNIPLEWSPNGGIGRMLAALGVNATTMTDEVRAALEPKP